jgi:hypothetical protein
MEDRRSLPPYEDELSLALLRSADQDEPSATAYSKVATALGVSAAVGLGASLPAQAALVSNGLSGTVAGRWWGSAFAKLAVVGVSSVLLVGGAALLRHRQHAAATAQLVAHAARAPRESGVVVTPTATAALANAVPAPTPPISLSSAPSAVPAPVLSASTGPASSVLASRALASNKEPTSTSSAASVPRAPKVSSLPEQVLSLDRARVALNSGDASGALAEIAHYRSTWPRGVFLTEASVLEIQALAKRGEIVLAGMRAQAFVTAHPDSPQVERLRALIPHAAR